MNYKFSNRELILLKALTAIVLLFVIIYGTSYLSNEITKSKNSLFSAVNKVNETKQLLAQIKVLENNKNLEVSANDFLKNLSENNISYEQKGDSTVIPGLSKLDALEIMANIEENNVAINNLSFVELDLLKDEGWNEAAEGCKYIIHVASPFPLKVSNDRESLTPAAKDGTLRVLNAGINDYFDENLKELFKFKQDVNLFFDNVIVNDQNQLIKKNRLELLKMLCKSFDNYFNFSKIEA